MRKGQFTEITAESERQSFGVVGKEADASGDPQPVQGSSSRPATELVAAPDEVRPPLSITGPSTRQGVVALDWLEWRVFGFWKDAERLGQVDSRAFRILEAGKRERAANDQGGLVELPCGEFVRVRASGLNSGVYFTHVMEFFGIVIGVRELPRAGREHDGSPFGESYPCALVRMTGVAMLQHGVGGVELVRSLLRGLGLKITSEVPSRTDIAADVFGVGVQSFVRLHSCGQCVSRAGKFSVHGEGVRHTGLKLMSKSVQLRVYDKLLESANDETQRALLERRWGGLPDQVTRVEFQINRDRLREMGINSLEGLFEWLPSLMAWLTEEWCRFVDRPVDRNNRNQSRVMNHWLWDRVRGVIESGLGELRRVESERPVRMLDCERLKKQVLGGLSSIAVLQGRRFGSGLEAIEWMEEFGRENADWLVRGVSAKSDQYAAAGRVLLNHLPTVQREAA